MHNFHTVFFFSLPLCCIHFFLLLLAPLVTWIQVQSMSFVKQSHDSNHNRNNNNTSRFICTNTEFFIFKVDIFKHNRIYKIVDAPAAIASTNHVYQVKIKHHLLITFCLNGKIMFERKTKEIFTIWLVTHWREKKK